jgi:hypothetical protein
LPCSKSLSDTLPLLLFISINNNTYEVPTRWFRDIHDFITSLIRTSTDTKPYGWVFQRWHINFNFNKFLSKSFKQTGRYLPTLFHKKFEFSSLKTIIFCYLFMFNFKRFRSRYHLMKLVGTLAAKGCRLVAYQYFDNNYPLSIPNLVFFLIT